MAPPIPPYASHTRHNRRSPMALSVAELVIRCGGIPVTRLPAECVAGRTVSVATLLRREGRGPHSLDGPLRPRRHDRAPAQPPRRIGRKTAVAAGAMFAAAAVLGPSVLHDASLSVRTDGSDQPLAVGDGSSTETSAQRQPGRQGQFVNIPIRPLAMTAIVDVPAQAARPIVSSEPVIPPPVVPPPMIPPPMIPLPRAATPAPPVAPPPAQVVIPGQAQAPGWAPPGGLVTVPPGVVTPADPPPVVDLPPAGPALTLPLPTARTTPVTVPGASVDGVARTPSIGVSAAEAIGPTVTVAAGADGAAVVTSPAEVTTPDVTVAEAQVGPLSTTSAEVGLPDVAIGGAGVSVTKDAGVQAVLPSVEVSETKVVTPDVKLGEAKVALPDVTLPAVSVPEVSLAPEDLPATTEKVAEAATDTVTSVGKAATATLDSLLGGR